MNMMMTERAWTPNLKTKRCRQRIVITGRAAANPQRAFAVFAPKPEPGLHDGWENKNAYRLVCEFSSARDPVEESIQRLTDADVDIVRRLRLGLLCCNSYR